MAQETTVSVRGIRTTLEIDTAYDVRYDRAGASRTLVGARLSARAANGELIFSVGYPTELERVRIRPVALERIAPSKIPTPVVDLPAELERRSVIAPRNEDETARAYLVRLERGLGTGAYGRRIETEDGQAALNAAAAETQAGRRDAGKPTKAPRSDDRCWPHPCRDYHRTEAHRSGEDPCNCRCHEATVAEVGVPVSVEVTPRGRKIIAQQIAETPVVGRSRGADLSPEEEARRAANRAREMARNVQWTCGTCHRRTRQPECSNGHAPVAAPVGTRREHRGAK